MIVELDRIFILAEPSTNVEGGDADSVQEAKNRRVRVCLILSALLIVLLERVVCLTCFRLQLATYPF